MRGSDPGASLLVSDRGLAADGLGDAGQAPHCSAPQFPPKAASALKDASGR